MTWCLRVTVAGEIDVKGKTSHVAPEETEQLQQGQQRCFTIMNHPAA